MNVPIALQRVKEQLFMKLPRLRSRTAPIATCPLLTKSVSTQKARTASLTHSDEGIRILTEWNVFSMALRTYWLAKRPPPRTIVCEILVSGFEGVSRSKRLTSAGWSFLAICRLVPSINLPIHGLKQVAISSLCIILECWGSSGLWNLLREFPKSLFVLCLRNRATHVIYCPKIVLGISIKYASHSFQLPLPIWEIKGNFRSSKLHKRGRYRFRAADYALKYFSLSFSVSGLKHTLAFIFLSKSKRLESVQTESDKTLKNLSATNKVWKKSTYTCSSSTICYQIRVANLVYRFS